MARPRLISVKMLRNHGARIVYRTSRATHERYIGPDGYLSAAEAARALGVLRAQIYRMAYAGRILMDEQGIPLAVVRILKAAPRARRGSVLGEAVEHARGRSHRGARAPIRAANKGEPAKRAHTPARPSRSDASRKPGAKRGRATSKSES